MFGHESAYLQSFVDCQMSMHYALRSMSGSIFYILLSFLTIFVLIIPVAKQNTYKS